MKKVRMIGCFVAVTMAMTSFSMMADTGMFAGCTNKSAIVSAVSVSDPAIGFASAAGVTGGGNVSSSSKEYVKVSSGDQLVTALSSASRKAGVKVIEITGDIDIGFNMVSSTAKSANSSFSTASQPLTHPTLKKTGVSQLKISDFNGLTIFSSNGAKIKHGCLVFSKCSNVKIQNLEFDELWEWDEKDKGNYDTNDWDYMTLKGCSGFWIDHCTFHKAYDGVVDSKDGTSGLTISWSSFLPGDTNSAFFKAMFDEMESNISNYSMYKYLRQTIGLTKEQIMKVSAPQKKTHLVGATEFNDTNNNLEVTLCYNYYKDSQDRLPRLRGGNAHVFNIVVDSNDAYSAGQIISGDKASKITSGGYHFGITSQAFVSTENGSLYVQDSIIKGVKTPQKNNQKSADKTKYTGKMTIANCYYECGNTKYTGSSTDANAPADMKPVPAAVQNFSWNKTPNLGGGKIPYSMKLYSLSELQGVLQKNSGTTRLAGTIDSGDTPVVTQAPVTAAPTTTAAQQTNPPAVTTKTQEPVNNPIASNVIFCSPTAQASGQGTAQNPTSVENAIKNIKAGGVIWLLEGTYHFDKTLVIDETNSGTANAYKTIAAAPGKKVIFDYTGMPVDASNRGVSMEGSYWHWYGIQIQKAGDNGMLLAGSHNIIEMCIFNNNQDTGLQLSRGKTSYDKISQWPSDNYIKNCTAMNNCDDVTMENADGFAAKLTCGEGNLFDGCMSYNNSDDGWDLYAKTATGPIGVVTFKNCISFRNGTTEDGRGGGDCDGNGFKLGGSGVGSAHVLSNCVSFENLHHGFTDNNNPLFGSLTNCTSVANSTGGGKANFQMDRCTSGTFKNLLSYAGKSNCGSDKLKGNATNTVFYNSSKYWKVDAQTQVSSSKAGTQINGPSDSDFVSVQAPAKGSDFHKIWRNEKGAIDTHGFLELSSSSSFKGMGAVMSEFSKQRETPLPAYDITPPTTEQPATQQTAAPTVTTATQQTAAQTVTTTTQQTTAQTASPIQDKITYGDVNEDGVVDVTDLTCISLYLLNDQTFTERQKKAADVTGNGTVDLADLAHLKQYVMMDKVVLGPR